MGKSGQFIEGIITGQRRLIDYPRAIKTLAKRYANMIIHQEASVIAEVKTFSPYYSTVDLNSVNNEGAITVGAEHVVNETIKQLEIDRKLEKARRNRI